MQLKLNKVALIASVNRRRFSQTLSIIPVTNLNLTLNTSIIITTEKFGTAKSLDEHI